MDNPTIETYEFLNKLCDAINVYCFARELPVSLLTLKGKSNVFGYYKRSAFVSHSGEKADEIAVNPSYFATHGFKELLQTLGHELCHQWQFHHGKPSKRAYHNKEFAAKMKSIGLIPSSTGEPGGKETGQRMADYMADTGLIVELYNRLSNEGIYIPWYERLSLIHGQDFLSDIPNIRMGQTESSAAQSGTTRSRYTHQCNGDKRSSVVYGKPNLPLVCGQCNKSWAEDI